MSPVTALQCPIQQVIGEMRVEGQDRTVQISSQAIQIDCAFRAVKAIVTVPVQDVPQGGHAAQVGASGVIFESGQSGRVYTEAAHAQTDIAHQPGRSRHGDQVEQPEALDPLPGGRLVIVAEQLVCAADRQDGESVEDGGPQVGASPLQIRLDQFLLPILAAAGDQQVEITEGNLLARLDGAQLHGQALSLGPLFRHHRVTAIAVETHE